MNGGTIIFSEPNIPVELSRLIKGARSAQRVLDEASQLYLPLRGECARTDALILAAIKILDGGIVWRFVRNNWNIQGDMMMSMALTFGDEGEEETIFDGADWKNITKAIGSESRAKLYQKLVEKMIYGAGDYPQSASSDSRYRRRWICAIERREQEAQGLSDQTFLRAIWAWKNDRAASASVTFVSNLVLDGMWAARLEYFQTALDGRDDGTSFCIDSCTDFFDLTSQVNAFGLRELKTNADSDSVKVLVPLRRIFTKKWFGSSDWREAQTEDQIYEWVCQQGELALEKSLAFLLGIDWEWSSTILRNKVADLRGKRYTQFFGAFQKDPTKLLSVIPEVKPDQVTNGRFSLYQFVEHIGAPDGQRIPMGEREWEILLPILSGAMNANPEKIALVSAHFFTSSSQTFEPSTKNYPRTWRLKEEFLPPSGSKSKTEFLKKWIISVPKGTREEDATCRLLFDKGNRWLSTIA